MAVPAWFMSHWPFVLMPAIITQAEEISGCPSFSACPTFDWPDSYCGSPKLGLKPLKWKGAWHMLQASWQWVFHFPWCEYSVESRKSAWIEWKVDFFLSSFQLIHLLPCYCLHCFSFLITALNVTIDLGHWAKRMRLSLPEDEHLQGQAVYPLWCYIAFSPDFATPIC